MADFDEHENWTTTKNDSNDISINIKKHIKPGRHRSKYMFVEDLTDMIDHNVQKYDGIDNIQLLVKYMEEMNLGNVEFSVFKCKSRANLPAFYANIKLGNISLASSFPEKYSLPDVAKQVAARNALVLLKKKHTHENVPVTRDIAIVIERLEKELQKNFAGLFCDKVEDIYKQVYNESLPSDWLVHIRKLPINILIEEIPNQNKSILYYASIAEKEKYDELMDSSVAETSTDLPLMKFIDKTERSVSVISVDSNYTFWIRFVHDSINDDFASLFQQMNMPDQCFIKMYSIEVLDLYAVQIENYWHRYQVLKIEDDNVTGIFIDMGVEWCVTKSDIKFLPPKFMSVPAQAIRCGLTSLVHAPYFEVANKLFLKLLVDKEFTVVPDDIERDVQLVTLYSGKCNMNTMIMEALLEETKFDKIDETCNQVSLSYIADGYLYLHPMSETLHIIESTLETISSSQPLHQLYSKKSVSPHKVYLVQCTEIDLWSRAIIDDFIINDQKFKVYFIDYGSYGYIDQDKFIDLQSVDELMAKIGPQALKVSFHLFPPEKLTQSLCKALYEMTIEKRLDINVVSTDNNGIPVVEIYDADDQTGNNVSFNVQLHQSV